MKAVTDFIDLDSLSREDRLILLRQIARSLEEEGSDELINSEFGPNRQQYISPDERSERNYGYMLSSELNKVQ